VKLIGLIGLECFFHKALQLVQGKAIDFGHFSIGYIVLTRRKIIQVAQHEAAGVSDSAVCIAELFQDIIGNPDVVPVIRSRHPEAQNLGAKFIDDLFRRNHITHGFGHLPPVRIHDKSMRQYSIVRSPVPGADGCQQGTVKPSAMLITALQI